MSRTALGTGVRERRIGWACVAPALLMLAGVAGYPLLAAGWLGLQRMILVFRERSFVGFDNYAFLLEDPRFWSALGHTTYFTVVATAVEFGLGLGLALLLDPQPGLRRELGPTRLGRNLLRATILLPWAIPTVVSAELWAWLFNAEYGLLTALLPGSRVDWLASPRHALHAAILVDVWKTTPFVTLLLVAGLSTIPRELYEAAALDGARRLQVLRSVQLPLLKPMIAVAVLLRALDAFRVFDAVYVLTGGGPGNSTETLSIYAYKLLMRAGDFGYGSAVAVATFVCTVLLAAIVLAAFGRRGVLQ